MTKANQVAPLLATLRGLIPDATEAIDEFAKLAKYVDEVEARAEQAEYSLAASERALAALRYQAQAGGCELSTVGENSYHCRADAPCGLCRLRHRASQAERSLATVTAERDEARDRAERAEVQLAGCGSAALGYVDPPAKKGDYGWSASYGDVLALRAKLAKTARERDDAMTLAEERRDYARAQNAKLSVECDDLRAQLTAVERERDEARADLEVARNPKHPDAVAWMKHLEGCDVLPGGTYAPVFLSSVSRLFTERDAALAKLAEAERERDEARAERDVATKEEDRAKLNLAKAAEQIEALRARLAKTEKVVEAAREDAQHCPHACSPPCPFDRAVARTRAALRALDSPVGAGTDSGGASGAATPEGGHAAPTGGPMPPPEPAGISQPDPLAALAAVLSLPLTEEDRKRIEGVVSRLRPEQPRGGLLPEPWERRPSLDPQAHATRAERCTTFCVEDSATCRRRAGHSGQHAASLNVARQLDETVTRAELDELRRRVEWLENLMGCTPKE